MTFLRWRPTRIARSIAALLGALLVCTGLAACGDNSPPDITFIASGRNIGEKVHVTIVFGGKTVVDKDTVTPFSHVEEAYKTSGTLTVVRLDGKPGPIECKVVGDSGSVLSHVPGNAADATVTCPYNRA